jgi:hypothetical protein
VKINPLLSRFVDENYRTYAGAAADTVGGLIDMTNAIPNGLLAAAGAKYRIPQSPLTGAVPEPKGTPGKVMRFVSPFLVPSVGIAEGVASKMSGINPLMRSVLKTGDIARAGQAVVKSASKAGPEAMDPIRRKLLIGAAAAPIAAVAAKAGHLLPAAEMHVAEAAVPAAQAALPLTHLHASAMELWGKASDHLNAAQSRALKSEEVQTAYNEAMRAGDYQKSGAIRDAALKQAADDPEYLKLFNNAKQAAVDAGHEPYMEADFDPMRPWDYIDQHLEQLAEARKAAGPYANSPISGMNIERMLDMVRDGIGHDEMLEEMADQAGYAKAPKIPENEAGVIRLLERIEKKSPGVVDGYMAELGHPQSYEFRPPNEANTIEDTVGRFSHTDPRDTVRAMLEEKGALPGPGAAKPPLIYNPGDPGWELKAFDAGDKHAAFLNGDDNAQLFRDRGYLVEEEPWGNPKRPKMAGGPFMAARTPEHMAALKAARDMPWGPTQASPQSIAKHVAQGRALGYPEEEIQRFVEGLAGGGRVDGH